ncbi:unnamed protein product [Spirodela intermedia]|uniref:Uncharacterized protein n=1 Tax=Spirodela intermedia TaxID=51605 RepID=A0A7I8LDJ1_SPIIN|nr:unnamed protein product [Spirodela intermedia]
MGGVLKDHKAAPPGHCLTRKLLTRSLYALFLLGILHICLFPRRPLQAHIPSIIATGTGTGTDTGTTTTTTVAAATDDCDYSVGQWVRAAAGPQYNGSSCATIKDGQNCMAHGRPDAGYLYWRWQPQGCSLPPFDAVAFLHLLRDRHVAFVGDSMARNQLDDGEEGKFRRWRFPSHNATVSVFWSPFLVEGVEKSAAAGLDHNELFLDEVDRRWAAELGSIHWVVLSVGHWFLHPAVYYDKRGGAVLGCHYCPNLNHTEVGFFGVYQRAFRTALAAATGGSARNVVVATFSPAHFEGEWDKAGACPKTEPYSPGEKPLQWMDMELRRLQLEEAAAAGAAPLDVTAMAGMRPDGHPGPYMRAFPFAGGATERVQNDCVHWCLPGPVDAWNEILLQLVRRRSLAVGGGGR